MLLGLSKNVDCIGGFERGEGSPEDTDSLPRELVGELVEPSRRITSVDTRILNLEPGLEGEGDPRFKRWGLGPGPNGIAESVRPISNSWRARLEVRLVTRGSARNVDDSVSV